MVVEVGKAGWETLERPGCWFRLFSLRVGHGIGFDHFPRGWTRVLVLPFFPWVEQGAGIDRFPRVDQGAGFDRSSGWVGAIVR